MPIGQFLIPVSVYAAQKIINIIVERITKGENPIVDQSFNVGITNQNGGRTAVDKGFTVKQNVPDELIVGNFYFPYTVNNLLSGQELILVVVVDEGSQQVFFFPADYEGYELFLPHSAYSFLVLLVDVDGVNDPLYGDILAFGLPSAVDLSGIEDLLLEDYDDIWKLLIGDPLKVGYGGPFYLDFVLLDTFEHPEFPGSLLELFAG